MRYIFISIIGLFVCSCGDFFENTIQLDEIHEETLAVTAAFNKQDSIYSVFLTKTISATSPPKYDTIKNASVILNVNNEERLFQYNNAVGLYQYPNTMPLDTGDDAEIHIQTSAFDVTNAIQQMPSSPNDFSVQQTEDVSELPSSGVYTVSFTDPAQAGNYYIIEMIGLGIGYNYETRMEEFIDRHAYISSENPSIEYNGATRVYFSDKDINGEKIAIDLNYWIPLDTREQFEFKLISTTQEGYLYALTFDKYQDTSNNPFAEPVTLYSNINNGVGVFSLSDVSSVIIR